MPETVTVPQDQLFLEINTAQQGAPELHNRGYIVPFGVDLMLRATVTKENPNPSAPIATNRTPYSVPTVIRTSRQTVNRATGGTDAAPDQSNDQDVKYDRADAFIDYNAPDLTVQLPYSS